ncbi:hypothetical protein CQW23_13219 [Capsicum baccatum]|uniref:NB-ARC domain-containing protein n=1 Tax=Capsicum baccatum TaxID=33114 RepID=A0A2G2WUY9_CAPBA|nr:hypothetical protein CQW23_13219 [Capsicum baccatum]
MSDGPLFMTLLLRNLNEFLNFYADSVVLIEEEISWVKEDLEHIRSFFRNVEQELHRYLWTRVLDVAYEAEHSINSILAGDRGLFHLIFLLPNTIEKIKLFIKRGFEEETEWIIRKLTSGPSEVDVISIVGMPGLGKTTLAYRVYNDKSVIGHFDVRSWCTIDQERNDKKLLQKIFNQVIGLKGSFNEDRIDHDVVDKLRKHLFVKRKEKKEALWLEVLNNLSSFIFKDEEEVMKVIQLSYGQLSDHLKPCFLYLASYPKDEDIDISLLKHLWSNEGLVEPNDFNSVEEVMELYMDELISSSLVIVRGEVELNGFDLTSDELLRIGRSLPKLQKLRLSNASIQGGKEWNMEQVTFHNLKSLALFEIPESFGDIASLKSIVVLESPRAEELALKMKKYIEEITGEDRLDVQFCYILSIMAPNADQSDPLFIGASDSSSVVLVPIKLTGSENYSLWSRSMCIALLWKRNFGFFTGTWNKKSYREELHEQWETCNTIVISWILNTVSESLLYGIVYATNGCAVWEDLKEIY